MKYIKPELFSLMIPVDVGLCVDGSSAGGASAGGIGTGCNAGSSGISDTTDCGSGSVGYCSTGGGDSQNWPWDCDTGIRAGSNCVGGNSPGGYFGACDGGSGF